MEGFQLPYLVNYISDSNLDYIRNDALQFVKNNPEAFDEAWRCPTLSNIKSEKVFYNEILKQELLNSAYEYYELFQFEYPDVYLVNKGHQSNLEITNCWINIAPPNAYQEGHYHLTFQNRKMLFSGVLYLDVSENCGDLRLYNPSRDKIYHMLPTKLLADKFIKPENGKLIMFPSWLEHSALHNYSNKNRVSISWNIEYTNLH